MLPSPGITFPSAPLSLPLGFGEAGIETRCPSIFNYPPGRRGSWPKSCAPDAPSPDLGRRPSLVNQIAQNPRTV